MLDSSVTWTLHCLLTFVTLLFDAHFENISTSVVNVNSVIALYNGVASNVATLSNVAYT